MTAELLLLLALSAIPEWSAAPLPDQCTVNVRWPDAARQTLLIEAQTWRAELDVADPTLRVFGTDDVPLVSTTPGGLLVGGVPVTGPGRVNIYSFGTQMYEIHLRDLKAEGFENGEIELALYAYGDRLFVNLNVRTYDGSPAPEAAYASVVHDPALTAPGIDSVLAETHRAVLAYPAPEPYAADGTAQSAAFAVLSGGSMARAEALRQAEARSGEVQFTLDGGMLDGYRPSRGFYQITVDHSGPRHFEAAVINPNQRYEVAIEAASPFPADIICNVRQSYGVLEGAVLTDEHGFPLPEQVMVCKNFGSEFEEGKEEGDQSYSEAYFPLSLTPEAPFKGRLYHLFGNWGSRQLRQISSIRFFHHYFHTSLGPTETFCYVPFEYPRDDDRNYVLADVRGLTNFFWPDQPQHHHVSVVGAMRYMSEGRWVNNLLQDTRIYLTSPTLASISMDYLSEDGKVKTTLHIFETPENDEARAYIRYSMEVLDDVPLDGPSSQNLRFLNAGAYIVQTRWPKLVYTGADGAPVHLDVPESDQWVAEAVPLAPQHAVAAAYSHTHGNMAFYVNAFKGVLGGQEVPAFGLSCFGGTQWTEMFLTAPGQIEGLKKGDHFDADLFVMPYGRADILDAPALRQRYLFGEKPVRLDVTHGEKLGVYPPRLRADARGFARFTLTDGHSWVPIMIEGFPSHKAPMLWELSSGQWILHDQQVHGNDWYQTYRAEDGSTGIILAVNLRPDMSHDYVVGIAPNAIAITQRNGYVTVEGGPMDFISPVAFEGLDSQPLDDTGLLRCIGDAPAARSVKY